MIRVLHVVTYMGRGGLETVLMNYYRNIDRSEIQFDFLVHRDFRADYDDEIEALGGFIHRLPRLVPWSKSYKKALENFFRSHPEYKIVHVHQDCLSSVVLKIAEKCGVPIRLAHSHASSQDKNFKYIIKLHYMRYIPKFATELFACSKQAGDWMFRGAPYTVLNNAIDVKKYAFYDELRKQLRDALGIDGNTFTVGHTGRFAPAKNHDFIIDVFSEIKKRIDNAKLLLIGDGDLKQRTIEKAEALGVSDSVIFTGVRDDVPQLLNAMDVFIMPSIYEGLGLAAIEAQANGLPCVISDNVAKDCDISNLVHRLSLNASAEEWARLIISLADTPRKDMIETVVSAGYDIKQNAERLTEHYIKLLEDTE